jgi:site-specific DNA-methyltransferase (adenine-specific)
VRRAGLDGISGDDLFALVYDGQLPRYRGGRTGRNETRDRRALKAQIWRINQLLKREGLRIRGSQCAGGQYRLGMPMRVSTARQRLGDDVTARRFDSPVLPDTDNTSEGLATLLAANRIYRARPWPVPFDTTTHKLHEGDARDLSWIRDESVDLVVTSPPYWTLKKYRDRKGQLGEVAEYETFLTELDKVWRECERVLVEGGRICCVVGDVCIPRKRDGRHRIMPLHADIQVRARNLGLDCLTPILWHKIANGVTEAQGNGAGFYGKPYQPGAVIKNDIEYIIFMRKRGEYRKTSMLQKALSILTKEEMQSWFRSFWTDIKGASTRAGHPAPYPAELAERLIRMFSFAGDTVLDPFLGTASTTIAAIRAGRNSIGGEIEPQYLEHALSRAENEVVQARLFGARKAVIV